MLFLFCPVCGGEVEQDKLVTAYAKMAVTDKADLRFFQWQKMGGRIGPAVNDDKVIAQTVHFCESKIHSSFIEVLTIFGQMPRSLTEIFISGYCADSIINEIEEQDFIVQTLPEKAFVQASQEDDAAFFSRQMPDSLMDLGARTAVTALYRTAMPVGGHVLDLMAGSLSHLPEDAVFQEFVGLDVNKKALAANPSLSRFVVQNLNSDPILPFQDDCFDAVLLCDGLAYLVRPQAVLEEILRVLKPGLPLIVTFSDQVLPAKAVAIWQALEPEDRVRYVAALMQRSGFGTVDTGEVTPPEELNAWKDSVHAVIGRKSMTS